MDGVSQSHTEIAPDANTAAPVKASEAIPAAEGRVFIARL
ncbi:hypothetical protein GCM10009857_09540 [Agromyces soli]